MTAPIEASSQYNSPFFFLLRSSPRHNTTCGDCLPKLLIEFGRRAPGFENARILTDCFFGRITGDLGKFRIDVFDSAFPIGDDDRHRALLECLKQFAQVRQQLFLLRDLPSIDGDFGDGRVGQNDRIVPEVEPA